MCFTDSISLKWLTMIIAVVFLSNEIAVAKPTAPSISQSGLCLWLKADAGIKANRDGEVNKWEDQSPERNHATISPLPGVTPPLWKKEGWNGRPVVHFDGAALMTTEKLATNGAEYSIFIVCSLGGGFGPVFCGDTGRSGWGLNRENDMKAYGILHGGVAAFSFGSLVNPANPQLLSIASGAGSVRFYAFGEFLGQMNFSLIPPQGHTFIGGINDDSIYCGDIAEVIIYNRRLANGERIRTERYLAEKYGLYHPNASWISSYSQEVQDQIYDQEWSKDQAEKYLAFLATHPAISPAGLSLWLRADNGVVTVNHQVTEWHDQSPSVNNAYGVPGTGRPFLVEHALHGHPVIRFNGDGYLATNTAVATGQDFSVFVVTSLNKVGTFYNGDSGTTGWGLGGLQNRDTYAMLFGGQGLSGFGLLNHTVQVRLLSATRGSGTSRFYVDGEPAGTGYMQMSPATKATFIGACSQDYIFSGELAEIVVYNCCLDDTKRKNVESYLQKKYGLEAGITQNHLVPQKPADTAKPERKIVPVITPQSEPLSMKRVDPGID